MKPTRSRVLVIFKSAEDVLDDVFTIADAVCPLGFEFIRNGHMMGQYEFQWLGFEWEGPQVPNEIEIVTKIKAAIPAPFNDACIIFNPDPDTVRHTTLTFRDGQYAEVKH